MVKCSTLVNYFILCFYEILSKIVFVCLSNPLFSIQYYFEWLTRTEYGKGNPSNTHISNFINICPRFCIIEHCTDRCISFLKSLFWTRVLENKYFGEKLDTSCLTLHITFSICDNVKRWKRYYKQWVKYWLQLRVNCRTMWSVCEHKRGSNPRACCGRLLFEVWKSNTS